MCCSIAICYIQAKVDNLNTQTETAPTIKYKMEKIKQKKIVQFLKCFLLANIWWIIYLILLIYFKGSLEILTLHRLLI